MLLPFSLHAALPPVAHAAARRPPFFNPGPTIGDFPPRVRGPVAGLFGAQIEVHNQNAVFLLLGTFLLRRL